MMQYGTIKGTIYMYFLMGLFFFYGGQKKIKIYEMEDESFAV